MKVSELLRHAASPKVNWGNVQMVVHNLPNRIKLLSRFVKDKNERTAALNAASLLHDAGVLLARFGFKSESQAVAKITDSIRSKIDQWEDEDE